MPLELGETRPRSMQFSIVESCFLKVQSAKLNTVVWLAQNILAKSAVQPRDHIPVNTMRKPQNHTFAVLI